MQFTRSRRCAQSLMWLLVATYTCLLTVHGSAFEPFVDGWLCVLTQFVPALVCWLAVPGAGARRPEICWLAIGITAFAFGNVALVLAEAHHTSLDVPSTADIGYLAFYPAVLATLVLAARRELRAARRGIWLDSIVGGFGAAAAVAVLLGPAFSVSDQSIAGTLVSLSFPLLDLALVFVVVAIAALKRFRLSPSWMALMAGFAVFACADVIYDRSIASGSYHLGTPLDATWAIGLTLTTLWATRRPAERAPATAQPTVLAVPAIAIALSLGVLITGTITAVPMVAVALAALTVVLTGVRTQLAFGHQWRLGELRRQAGTDDLTGLANRRAFYAQAARQLAVSPRSALLLLDLDKFKEVNDSLGHHIGDRLLVGLGARLATLLRDYDLLARLGGDEFALLLTDVDQAQAEAAASRIHAELAAPFALNDIMIATDVSIGIALAPEHGMEVSGLLRRADIAMYKAKRARLKSHVYAAADESNGDDRLRTLQELRTALHTDQFVLHFQPKLDLRTDEICGVEALVRWDHPRRGLVYPDGFLPLIEEGGMMPALTERVLALAVAQAADWAALGRPLPVAVNVSASSLVDDELPEFIAQRLAARQLPACMLKLEITEESLMDDRDRGRRILHRLRDQGIEISVDDFGTGYSSLAYLRDLPIDELKLDRAFVFPMADDARAAALVVSTIGLAHSLGLRMVAEGVENDTALAELARHGCDQAQGFHIARPMPAVELDHWLSLRVRERQTLPAR
ncbi:EAL domain-containing protein [Jatrophihabitans telluris]|uniref:EAL domain-containing protein n=1 Tax=Jatrophihabitans telluris TaxID=2038343 RepID=A0ABY4QV34_9ACTN|nr:EAL domain-containing protein [Jatrophihabitans telluris]UQX86967.1 EAL domain-containing protein [Jatrophihabitans telluris]